MRRHSLRLLLGITTLGASLLTGCALTSKSAPLEFRYFSLDDSKDSGTPQTPAAPSKKLRLGAIGASSHLRERMVVRSSEFELGYRELERWSERPQAYLARSLSNALFEQHGIEQALAGGGYALDATLLSFDEIATSDPSKVRVTVSFVLHDDIEVALEATVSREHSVDKSDDPNARVAAFRSALGEVIEVVANQVATKLQELPAKGPGALPEPPPPPPENATR